MLKLLKYFFSIMLGLPFIIGAFWCIIQAHTWLLTWAGTSQVKSVLAVSFEVALLAAPLMLLFDTMNSGPRHEKVSRYE